MTYRAGILPHCRGGTAVAVASPAVAQQPTVKWRSHRASEGHRRPVGPSPTVAKFVNEMSDGKFVIDTFAAGEIVPGLQCWTRSPTHHRMRTHLRGYYVGRIPRYL